MGPREGSSGHCVVGRRDSALPEGVREASSEEAALQEVTQSLWTGDTSVRTGWRTLQGKNSRCRQDSGQSRRVGPGLGAAGPRDAGGTVPQDRQQEPTGEDHGGSGFRGSSGPPQTPWQSCRLCPAGEGGQPDRGREARVGGVTGPRKNRQGRGSGSAGGDRRTWGGAGPSSTV